MIVFCCVLPASNKARDDDDDEHITKRCHQTHDGNFVKSQPIFKILFTTRKRRKFPIKSIYYFPPHLKYFAALHFLLFPLVKEF